MKKIRAVAAILLLPLLLFSACGKTAAETAGGEAEVPATKETDGRDGDAVTVLLDHVDGDYALLRLAMQAAGAPENVEFTDLPNGFSGGNAAAERETALSHLRAEIMAGGGPDVFIVDSRSLDEKNYLFRKPESAMENGMFYPLDDLIANAKFMEWDRLTPGVMAAGKSEKYGQVILPFDYTFRVSLFDADEVTHVPSRTRTWDDVLNGDDDAAKSAVFRTPLLPDVLPDSLGQLADYGRDRLAFTEDELLARLEEFKAIQKARGEDAGTPECLSHNMMLHAEFMACGDGDRMGEDFTVIPIYSDDGGVTVDVTRYGAVNANAKDPEEAFAVLDFLLSREAQQQYFASQHYLPVYEDLMTQSSPVDGWYMSERTYESFSAVRDCITGAILPGALQKALTDDTLAGYVGENGAAPPADVTQQTAKNVYTELKMILAE